MEILELIKKRATVRKYKNKKIPTRIIDKIVEAGIWGPSIHRIQPWKFVVVEKKYTLDKIKKLISGKLNKIGLPSFIFYPTVTAIANAYLMIFVYNTGSFSTFSKKINRDYLKNAKIAEISAISASIQNMILVAEGLGIGSCWLNLPLFCKKEISKFLRIKEELSAVLTFGYPEQKGNRTIRKPFSETVIFLNRK
jgi:nitroreductase